MVKAYKKDDRREIILGNHARNTNRTTKKTWMDGIQILLRERTGDNEDRICGTGKCVTIERGNTHQYKKML